MYESQKKQNCALEILKDLLFFQVRHCFIANSPVCNASTDIDSDTLSYICCSIKTTLVGEIEWGVNWATQSRDGGDGQRLGTQRAMSAPVATNVDARMSTATMAAPTATPVKIRRTFLKGSRVF